MNSLFFRLSAAFALTAAAACLVIGASGAEWGEELVRRSIASGEFAFLAKPFPPEELVRRVGELLRGGNGGAV